MTDTPSLQELIVAAEQAGDWKRSGRLKSHLLMAGPVVAPPDPATITPPEELPPPTIDQGGRGAPTSMRTLEQREADARRSGDRAALNAISREKTAALLARTRR